MKKLMKVGYYGFITAVLALGLLLVATLIPIPGNYEVKIVQSGSMAPTITTGSIVIVKPTSAYEIDDIITYGEDTAESVPTTHRIVEKEVIAGEYHYTTKGDANEDADPQAVPEDEIVGEVLFSLPYLGYILDFARQPLGFILLVGLPASIVVIDEITTIYKEIARAKGKKEEDIST